jgi:hypothetical protein
MCILWLLSAKEIEGEKKLLLLRSKKFKKLRFFNDVKNRKKL